MKKRLLSVALLMGGAFIANAQVGIGTATPNKSAELTIVAANRGLLIPNVSLTDAIDKQTITNGNIESLLVYNTSGVPSRTGKDSVTPGYYYWFQGRWHRLTAEMDIPQTVVDNFQDILDLDGDRVKNLIKSLFSETLTVLSYDENTNKITYRDENQQEKSFVLNSSDLFYDATTNTFSFIDASGKEKELPLNNTSLSYNPDNSKLTYIDSKNQPVEFDLNTIVKDNQYRTIVKQGDNVIVKQTVIANQTTYTVSVEQASEDTPGVVKPGKGLQVSQGGVLDVDFPFVEGVLADGNLYSKSITVSGEANPIFKDVTLEITPGVAGQVLTTKDNGDGTFSTIWENQQAPLNAGQGLIENKKTGSIDVDYPVVREELAKGNVSSTSITVQGGDLATFSDVALEITPGTAGQVLTTKDNGDGTFSTIWQALPEQEQVNVSNGLTKDNTGTIIVDYPVVRDELAKGNVSSTSITVQGGDLATFSDVALEITPGTAGQVLTTKDNGDGTFSTIWQALPEQEQVNVSNGLTKDNTGTIIVDYPVVRDELAKGNVSSTSITVQGGDLATFSDVALEITPGVAGQVLTTKDNGDGTFSTIWQALPEQEQVNVSNGLTKDNTGTIIVDYPAVKEELAKGNVSSTSITVKGGDLATFSDVALEITPGVAGQVLTTKDNGDGTFSTIWENQQAPLNAGQGLIENKKTGSIDVDYPVVREELAKGNVSSKSITVQGGDLATFSDVALEITPGEVGQVLTTKPGKNPQDPNIVEWENAKATMPKFFYMPSIVLPVVKDQINIDNNPNVSYDEANKLFTVNLYENYKAQFTKPIVSSVAVDPKIPVLESNELHYHITWYDKTVYTDVKVNAQGVLTYKITDTPEVTVGSFMNIVFEVINN